MGIHATIWPDEMVQAFKPDHVAPLVGFLTSEANQDTTGKIYEVSAGWCAAVRWQRSFGYSRIDVTSKALEQIVANFGAKGESKASSTGDSTAEDYADSEDSELVATAKKVVPDPMEYTFTKKDCIGAHKKQLEYVYEANEDF
ncbi:hypothetical protein MJO28_005255 [Puccinia striiformis f. sp. tritici]|uniref:Uncharacterized protein n=1 Tax=Puccinia striiformis f. sp. tritici TaxID=168172 RepID=A0ACC0EKP7_9BASI|nr:hypothetical protein MJO28_005255 [Puccinia striiformis f. sp. tritici]